MILILLSAGILTGILLKPGGKMVMLIARMVNWFIYLLLFLLGISVGLDERIMNNMMTIGIQALLMTLFTIGGSMVGAFLLYRKFFSRYEK